MRTRIGAAGASLALLALAEPALAETVVVKCTVTSGDPAGLVGARDEKVGAAAIYKIGDDRWLEWDEARGAWHDLCHHLGYLDVDDDPPATGGCGLSPTEFSVSLSRRDDDSLMEASLKIDRRSGALGTYSSLLIRGYDPVSRRAAGACETTEEPIAAVPATKF